MDASNETDVFARIETGAYRVTTKIPRWHVGCDESVIEIARRQHAEQSAQMMLLFKHDLERHFNTFDLKNSSLIFEQAVHQAQSTSYKKIAETYAALVKIIFHVES